MKWLRIEHAGTDYPTARIKPAKVPFVREFLFGLQQNVQQPQWQNKPDHLVSVTVDLSF